MTKEKYMALADFQTLWTNSIKPYIVAGFIGMLAGTDANAKNLVLADGTNIAQATFISATEKGANSGVATLGADGKVPSSQLPSFVDDVIEAANFAALPAEGEAGKIYVTLDNNKTYRWGGSAYVEISASIALGETQGTAYEGSKGKANADAIAALQTDKANKSEMAINAVDGDATKKEIVLKTGTSQEVLVAHQDISGKQDEITASGILKGDGSGGVTAAVAGTDYQTPLVAGTDYQTPLVAGTDYQTPLVAGTDYVVPVSGKGLSTEDYTSAEKTKLSGIAAGAQVNAIETVKVNGTALTPDANKAVDVTFEIPERVSASDLEGFIV
jgi:hypothetical protein